MMGWCRTRIDAAFSQNQRLEIDSGHVQIVGVKEIKGDVSVLGFVIYLKYFCLI
jgi:hypothetical protein